MSSSDWERQHGPRFAAIADLVDDDAERFVDVGAAPYHVTRRVVARARRQGGSVHAVALNKGDSTHESDRLVLAGTAVDVRFCDVEHDRWPLADSSVDVVIMGAILEHLLDPLAALSEARRVSRPDGQLVLSTPNALRGLARAEMVVGRSPWDGFDAAGDPHHRHNHEWTAAELRDICPAAGWDVEQLQTVSLERSGLTGRLYRATVSRVPALDDQLLLSARPTEPTGDRPAVYRKAVVDRHAPSPSQTTRPGVVSSYE